VSRKLPRLGLTLAGSFLVYSSYFILLAYQGAWQGPFFILFATFPFSVFINQFMNWLQELLRLSNQIRSLVEISINCVSGTIEFYVIGYLIERGTCRRSKKMRLEPGKD